MSANNILAKMAVQISAQSAGFNQAMKQNTNQLKAFQGTVNNVNNTLRAFGVGFGIYELARGVSNAIGTIAEFEKTMSEVKAITGATGAEFQKLESDALRLGASTKYTSTQVGQLQMAYGRLGFTTKEILDATEATLNLAAATGEDLAKSADVAGSTVRGFGLNAVETQRVVDVMASSFNKTALGLENFTESMKYVAPVGNAAGATVEEVTAMLGVLADAGIRGSMAGTSLRKIFTDMTKDGRPLQERLLELGKKGITLADSFDEVGRTAQTSLLILTKNTNKIDQLTSAFQGASGEAAKMARIMQDNLTGDVVKLTSAWEGLLLKMSDTTTWRNVIQNLTKVVNLISGTKTLDTAFENVVANIRMFNEVDPTVLKALSEARKEMGKPISFDQIEAVTEKYKLTSSQARTLYQAVVKANEAMSFSEKTMSDFNKFAKDNEKTYDNLSKAVDGYKQKIYEAVFALQIEQEKAYTKELENEIKEKIAAYRRQINILNEYKATLTSVADAEGQALNFPKFEKPTKDRRQVDIKDEFYSRDINMDPASDFMRGIDTEDPVAGIVAENNAIKELIPTIDELNQKREDQIDAMMRTAQMAESMGTMIGDALGEAISGTEDFGQTLSRIVPQIIKLLASQAIASIIAAGAKEGAKKGNVIVGVAAAALGAAAISSMFAGIGKRVNVSTGGSGGPGRTPSEATNVNIHGKIRGYDLDILSKKTDRRRGRLG